MYKKSKLFDTANVALQKNSTEVYINISLGIIFSFFYLLVSASFVGTVPIVSDTREYFYNFQNIESIPFPYDIEVVTMLMMSIVYYLGGDFEFFLYVMLFIWVPLVFKVGFHSNNNLLMLFVFSYLCSPYFMSGALFLIRQYNAALFFLFFLYFYHKNMKLTPKTFVLMSLSLCSHISAVLWFVVILGFFDFLFKKPFFLIALFFCSFLFFFADFYNLLYLVFIELKDFINIGVLSRKLNYYHEGCFISNRVGLLHQVVSFTLCASCFFVLFKSKFKNRIVFFILVQSLIVITFREHMIMANRFGFFGYFFCVPLLFLVWSCFSPFKLKFLR